MKKAKINIETGEIDGKFIADFYIDNLGDELFEMGNSSFVIEYVKDSLLNPEMTFRNLHFSENELYEKLELKELYKGWTSMIQFRLKPDGYGTEGTIIQNYWLCRVVFDRGTTKDINFRWRLRDTAIVTPTFETIQTEFFINDTLNFTSNGEGGNKEMDIELIRDSLTSADGIVSDTWNTLESLTDDLLNARTLLHSALNELNQDPPVEPAITFGNMALVGDFIVNSTAAILYSPHTPLYRMTKNGVKGWVARYHWIPTNPNHHRFALTLWTPNDFHIDGVNLYNPGNIYNGVGGDVGHRYGAFSDIFKGKYYQTWHENYNSGTADRMLCYSDDGVNDWSTPVKIGRYAEDSSLCVIDKGLPTEKLRMYVRPYYANLSENKHRNIVMIESVDGINWSSPVSIFNDATFDRQYYAMSVCQIAKNMHYAVVSMFNGTSNKVWLETYKSVDGINFTKLQTIALPSGMNQMFGAVSYDAERKKIIGLFEQSKGPHGEALAINPFGIARYEAIVGGV